MVYRKIVETNTRSFRLNWIHVCGQRTGCRVFVALDADQAGARYRGGFHIAVEFRHHRHQGILLHDQCIGNGQVLDIRVWQLCPQFLAAFLQPDIEFGEAAKP